LTEADKYIKCIAQNTLLDDKTALKYKNSTKAEELQFNTVNR